MKPAKAAPKNKIQEQNEDEEESIFGENSKQSDGGGASEQANEVSDVYDSEGNLLSD